MAPKVPRMGRRWKRGGAVAVVALVIGSVVWWRTKDAPPEPPLPPGITDAEVSAVVEKSRARVVATPRSGEAWGDYGTILLAHLFDREADQCFVVAARLDPQDPRWPYARGQIALKRDPPSAIALLTTASEAARAQPKYRTACVLTLAEALLEHGEIDRAADLLQQELAVAPGEARAIFGLGTVALLRGDDATAAVRFAAVQNNPCCRKQARSHLSQLARVRGDVAAAKQYESEANALDPDPPWPDPYLDKVVTLQVGARGDDRRVGVLERDGRFQEAAQLYLAQAQRTPTSKALTGAGVNLARLRDYDRAIDALRRAVELDPNDPRAHYTLALVLFNKAEREWVPNPNSADAASWFREVVEEAKRTIDLKPDYAQAYLFWGLSLKHLGDPRAAIEPLRKGLVIRPEEFEMHLALGQALAATGDRTGAEQSLRTAQKLKPDDPRPVQELAKFK
ncbi:tetratricopeptide repeat protein [Gemmata sp. G18]|uniref:Tetratricopeptide repeat protein n=1 Tax=Gemmata palustris TaxID=2822762 RepID=A0ABS5BLL9_9BACT|nr:tetratricopeptide repeat protein [Gemmata palustris]MBP3954607.1 tetratricopeptide repeat protein [Gemmata palustris]